MEEGRTLIVSSGTLPSMITSGAQSKDDSNLCTSSGVKNSSNWLTDATPDATLPSTQELKFEKGCMLSPI